LLHNRMRGGEGFRVLGAALARQERTLKMLSIGPSCDIIPMFPRGLILFAKEFLSNPNIFPEKVIFTGIRVDLDAFRILGNVLSSRTSASPIELLDMRHASFTRNGFLAFINALEGSPGQTPKVLHISKNEPEHITTIFAISDIVRKPNCSLEKFWMRSLSLDDDSVAHIANSLSKNEKILEFTVNTDEISITGWDHVANALCDTTTIASTYTSNHTLVDFGGWQRPTKISWYLELNKNPDKTMVARIKVIDCHFARNFEAGANHFTGIQPFLVAELLSYVHRFLLLHDKTRLTYNNNPFNQGRWNSENNSLTIHYLMLKNNLSILDERSWPKRKRQRI